jgi:hypothetical protein
LIGLVVAALCMGSWSASASAAPGGDRARVTHASGQFMKAVFRGDRSRALRFGTAKAYRAARADHHRGDAFKQRRCVRPTYRHWADWWPRAAWMCPLWVDYAGVDYYGGIGLFMKKRHGRWVVREWFRIAG